MRVTLIDPVTGARVDPGDSATQTVKGSVQINVVPPPAVQGGWIAFQADASGNLKTSDAELARDRSALEEMRLIAEANENILLCGRLGGSETRLPFCDRRGGSGQRGTIR